ncbi:MAG TPA: polyprenyl diphosphate synthase [Methanocorpusculum sp.]|nr:polyprenyl diphosphate synthase [Methanocorpusculum sp.]
MSLRTFLEDIYIKRVLKNIKYHPTHVALIQDGNRRYAKKHGESTSYGHRAGAENTIRVLEWMGKLDIKHVTFYAFSTENFKRDKEEINELLKLFIEKFSEMLNDKRIYENKINVSIIGDRNLIQPELVRMIDKIEDATKDHDRYYVHFALAYGGRNEIVETAKRVVECVREKKITPDDIDSDLITKMMYPKVIMPPVDLIIRTGNDKRTSNFLPWLANGNEAAVYFCAPTWPEFRYIDMVRALRVYDQRTEQKLFSA